VRVVNSYEAASECVPVSFDMRVDFPTDGNCERASERKGNGRRSVEAAHDEAHEKPSSRS
jgi:hypothetical protein